MEWIHNYQLYLFDLDGLLVNTEEMHFLAYRTMLKNRGFTLPWDFPRYCQTAHYHSDMISSELYALFPDLHVQEPDWNVLYAEKKNAMLTFVAEGNVQLMPGVKELLIALKEHGKRCCVVTHSPSDLVADIRRQQPILDNIPLWITRHDYKEPKPSPECYLKAIELYAGPDDAVVGFEDSPRGLRALMGTRATSVLVCQVGYPEIDAFVAAGARHLHSFLPLIEPTASTLGCVSI